MDFFSLDVTLDEKWELIEAEFGITGFGVIVKLLQRIYGGQGYYVEWTNEVALLFARKIGVGGNVVSEIVSTAIRRGIFDKTLYEKYSVLTSAGIQKRYFKAVTRRKSVEVINEYLLAEPTLFLDDVNIFRKNVNISSENVNISEQSKGKERKVKESKGKYIKQKSRDVPSEHAKTFLPERVREIVDLFNGTCKSLTAVSHLTIQRAERVSALLDEYSIEDFAKAFRKVELSTFLTGKDTKWKASFDWLIKDGNMAKVLEGQYDNRSAPSTTESSFDTDSFFADALKRSYRDMEGRN